MMTYLEKLTARRDAVMNALNEIGFRPNYSIDGESVSHAANRAQLMEELEILNRLIRQAAGPFLVSSQGRA